MWVQSKLIGKGSYGSVHIGVRESDGLRFAVKSAPKGSPSSLQALENEISTLKILSSSSSPFIVGYYGDDETTTHRNLHLEYLPGSDVAKSGGVTDVELIRSYTWCLVMALKEVHSKGIVHCDVKGSNVLVGSTTGVVKLSDFGSAMSVDHHRIDQTVKIVPRGSPLWMAPEVVRGESQGYESDIWSLGCTVIEMFTGLPAWQDRGAATLVQIGYSDELPEYSGTLPELGKDFLNKCLVRDPNARWNCDQLLQHPFLLPVPASSLINEASPRSIFDWQSLEFSDDDVEEDDDHDHDHDQRGEILGRIGELASVSGVNWESDGWVEVRSVGEEKEEKVSAGTSWEYSEFEQGERVNLEFHGDDCPTWNNLMEENNNHIDNDSDDRSVNSGEDGGDRCGHGDSCGGEKIQTSVSIDVLKYNSSFLLFFVLYAYARYNRKFYYYYKYECSI